MLRLEVCVLQRVVGLDREWCDDSNTQEWLSVWVSWFLFEAPPGGCSYSGQYQCQPGGGRSRMVLRQMGHQFVWCMCNIFFLLSKCLQNGFEFCLTDQGSCEDVLPHRTSLGAWLRTSCGACLRTVWVGRILACTKGVIDLWCLLVSAYDATQKAITTQDKWNSS